MDEKRKILLTGFRLVAILKFLSKKGACKSEIMKYFEEDFPFLGKFSGETLKLDINSLKKAGFNIKRTYKGGLRRYYLANPISLFKFSIQDCKLLNMIKFAAAELESPDKTLKLRQFFNLIRDFIPDECKGEIFDFGFLNLVNEQILEDLLYIINEKKCCSVIYNSFQENLKKLEVTPLQIISRGSKFYLQCYTKKYRNTITFRLDNIEGIENIRENQQIKIQKKRKIRYTVKKDFLELYPLENFETPVKIKPDRVEIEAPGEDFFFVGQRILTLGENCTDIRSEKMKKNIIKNLEICLEKYTRCRQ